MTEEGTTGLLFFVVTFWPAVICLVVGIVRVRRSRRGSIRPPMA